MFPFLKAAFHLVIFPSLLRGAAGRLMWLYLVSHIFKAGFHHHHDRWWGLTTGRGEGGGDSMMKLFSTRILSKYFTGFKKTLVQIIFSTRISSPFYNTILTMNFKAMLCSRRRAFSARDKANLFGQRQQWLLFFKLKNICCSNLSKTRLLFALASLIVVVLKE